MSDSQLVSVSLVFYIFCIHPLLVFFGLNWLIYWWRNRATGGNGGKTIWEIFAGGKPVTPKQKEL